MTRRSFTWVSAALLASVVGAGCASSAAQSAQPGADRVVPARMTSHLPIPILYGPIQTSSRGRARINLEVLIDESGRPDMRTFKTIGAGTNQQALAQWIESSSFDPARQGGIPVAGLYRGTFELRVERR